MKRMIFLICLLLSTPVFADHIVCLKDGEILMSNSDGKLKDIPTMEQNALSAGLNLNDVEIKVIPDKEFGQIWYDTVTKPNEDKKKIKKQKIKDLKTKLKTNLSLTTEEIDLLLSD